MPANRIANRAAAVALSSALCSSLLLSGCATPPEEDPVFIKLNELDQRLDRLERVLSNQSLLELSQQVQALQAELRSVRGSLEEIEHEQSGAQAQQRSLYQDLDQRIEALKNSGLASGSREPSGPLPVPGGSDRANYQAAFDLLKSGRYGEATAAFQQFLQTFPDSPLASNAQYWLGESYYVLRNYPEALAAFQQVVERYPGSSKHPDALLKIGYTQYEMKNWPAARGALENVRREFANSTAASDAADRLEKMKAEGH